MLPCRIPQNIDEENCMKRWFVCGMFVMVLALSGSAASASDISFITKLAQDEFRSLSKEAGAALGYRNLAPAAPLGISGFDIAAEASAISIDKRSSYWKSAFNSDAPSYLIIPKVRVRKGLPFGIDVGAMYSGSTSSNIKLYGVEVSKSILSGGAASPAIGVRGTFTKLDGVKDLGLQTYGADASISKGFVFITPYAGAGVLWVTSEAKGNLQVMSNLAKETNTVPRFFGGVKLTPFPLVGVTVEAEYAVRPIYSLKAGVSF